jgi:hypothetical protein
VVALPLRNLTGEHLRTCDPFRKFPWHVGQQHFPGWYWFATTGRLVPYESRLELSWLRIADMDPSVAEVKAQPFCLYALDNDGEPAHHTPDFACLSSDGGIAVIDAKPPEVVEDDDVVHQFEWTKRVLEGEGFGYEVWTGPSPQALLNSTFLACYRNPALHDPASLQRARGTLGGLPPHSVHSLETVEATLVAASVPEARSVLLHLVWTGELRIDLDFPIHHLSPLEVA